MKRTRRVEVIRYSRRSTVIGDKRAVEAYLAAPRNGLDDLQGIPCGIESSETFEKPTSKQEFTGKEGADVVRKAWLLRLLKRLTSW